MQELQLYAAEDALARDPANLIRLLSMSLVSDLHMAMQELQLYVAQDADALDAAIANKATTWCGWDRYLGGQRDTCAAQISPFKPALVGALRPAALFSREQPLWPRCRHLTGGFRT